MKFDVQLGPCPLFRQLPASATAATNEPDAGPPLSAPAAAAAAAASATAVPNETDAGPLASYNGICYL